MNDRKTICRSNGNGAPPDERQLLWLVVDDDEAGRELARALLVSEGYDVVTAADGFDALNVASSNLPDVILSDVLMPKMDGFVLCMHWQADPVLAGIPFIFSTANYVHPDDREFALGLGAAGYLMKPLTVEQMTDIADLARQAAAAEGKVSPLLPGQVLPDEITLETLKRYNLRLFNKLEEKLVDLERTSEQLERSMNGCLAVISAIMEMRDPYTVGHEQRVAELAVAIAERMNLPAERIEIIRIAAMLHDVGKVAVPAEILSKPGQLSPVELDMVHEHAAAGGRILSIAEFPRPVQEVVVQHHERLNGSGYPEGLTEADILPEARIIAVADVVEAMASPRPYRPALTLELALAEIRDHAGSLYDKDVVAACLQLFESGGFEFSEREE